MRKITNDELRRRSAEDGGAIKDYVVCEHPKGISQASGGHFVRKLPLAAALILLAAPILHAAPVRVIEEAAIPYMSFLSKADFDQRYPGEILADPAKLNTGWYVIYQHEMLNYYFGPMLLESIGEDYLVQLTETVEAAVAQRPSIQDYRLELSYEPSVYNADSSSAEPSAEPSTPNPLPPQPPAQPSFWGLVKKIFGFG
ncbi:MAG: hypothetical protein ACI9ZV_000410 [Candidatus Azotimanducaceae bacterium]|jgi:hypothetical protein